jgi:hypothetical protein
VRHEKLVHLQEGGKDSRAKRAMASQIQPDTRPDTRPDPSTLGMRHAGAGQSTFHVQPAPRQPVAAMPPRNAPCNLDLLSDAALASAGNPMQTLMPSFSHRHTMAATSLKPGPPQQTYGGQGVYPAHQRIEQQPASVPAGVHAQGTPGPRGDYSFFEDMASSSHFLPPPFDPEQQLGGWPGKGFSKPGNKFPSHLPTAQSTQRDHLGEGTATSSRAVEDQGRALPFRVLPGDHAVLQARVEEFSSVLPKDFVFPSRHTLIRFVEGYASGFHEHLPFLHLPTLSLVQMAPELLLAILSVGAQCRFEGQRGYALWYAARSVAFEQLRRRQTPEILALLPTAGAYSPHSTKPSPSTGHRHSYPSVTTQEKPNPRDAQRES